MCLEKSCFATCCCCFVTKEDDNVEAVCTVRLPRPDCYRGSVFKNVIGVDEKYGADHHIFSGITGESGANRYNHLFFMYVEDPQKACDLINETRKMNVTDVGGVEKNGQMVLM